MPVIKSESHTSQHLLRIRSPSIFQPSVNSNRRVFPHPRALHLHLLPGGIFRVLSQRSERIRRRLDERANCWIYRSKKYIYRCSKDFVVTQRNIFTQLPFQAAGNFRNGKPHEIIVNRAACSYTTSFRMLKWARSRSSKSSKSELISTIATMAARVLRRPPPSRTIFAPTVSQDANVIEEESRHITWVMRDKSSVAEVMCDLTERKCNPDEPSVTRLKLFKKM